MLDARPDEDDPEFDEKSRRASQRPNTDLGLRRSVHRRGSLGGLVDGLWQIKSEHLHSETTSIAHSKAGHVNTKGASKPSIAGENVDAHVPTQAQSHFGESQETPPPLISDDDVQGELHSRIMVPVQEVMDDSAKVGIIWCDPDTGRASPAKLTLGSVVDSGEDEPTGPSTTASASLCLSPQEVLGESIKLSAAWRHSDAGNASVTLTSLLCLSPQEILGESIRLGAAWRHPDAGNASVTLTSLADPGDETRGTARPPTGPSTTASASLCLSPQEILGESIRLGAAWRHPDAGNASVTLTSLAEPGDETRGIASDPGTGPSVAANLCRRFGCGAEDAIVALKLARGVIFAPPLLVSHRPVIAALSAQATADGRLRCCKSTGT